MLHFCVDILFEDKDLYNGTEIAMCINGKAHFPTLQCIGWADNFAQPVKKWHQKCKDMICQMSDILL